MNKITTKICLVSLKRVHRRKQAAAAPRFSETQQEAGDSPVAPGANSADILAALGYDQDAITQLLESGAVAAAN